MGLTTDKNSPCLNTILPDGQQACYLALTEEERAAGFVRPLRSEYRHVVCETGTFMPLAIAETYARDPKFYDGTYCAACRKHFPLVDGEGQRQFLWLENGKPDGTFVGE